MNSSVVKTFSLLTLIVSVVTLSSSVARADDYLEKIADCHARVEQLSEQLGRATAAERSSLVPALNSSEASAIALVEEINRNGLSDEYLNFQAINCETAINELKEHFKI